MSERWRKPVSVAAIEPDPEGVMTIGTRRHRNYDVTLNDRDDFQRLVEGYVCAQCFEPQETPFPHMCSLCGFRMKLEQAQRLDVAFKGEKWIGPSTSNEDELLRMMEENERRKRSKIVLPPGVRGT